jgi:hypothetical protein
VQAALGPRGIPGDVIHLGGGVIVGEIEYEKHDPQTNDLIGYGYLPIFGQINSQDPKFKRSTRIKKDMEDWRKRGAPGDPPVGQKESYPCITMEDILNWGEFKTAADETWSKSEKSSSDPFIARHEFGGFVLWNQQTRDVEVHVSSVEGETDRIGLASWNVYAAERPFKGLQLMTFFHSHVHNDRGPSGGDVQYLIDRGVGLGILIMGKGDYIVYNQDVGQTDPYNPQIKVTKGDLKKCLPTYDAPRIW